MLRRDPTGAFVPQGRVRKELVETFDDAALPPWLSVVTPAVSSTETGTVTYGDPASTEGYAQLNTTAVSGERCTLATRAIDLSKHRAVKISAEGVYFSAATVTVDLGFWDAAGATPQYGARIHHASTDGQATANSFPASGAQDELIDYGWAGLTAGEYARRRNIAVYIDCVDKYIAFMEDDQVFYYSRRTSMGLGPVVGKLRVQTSSAATKWARVEQLRLERWVN